MHFIWINNLYNIFSTFPNSLKNYGESTEFVTEFLLEETIVWPFPGGSAGKESACNAGDLASIPGSGSSPGEETGYLLQYSWASPIAQLVNNLPAVQETRVWSLGGEDPLEKGTATHSSILAWRIPWTGYSRGSQKVRHERATFAFTLPLYVPRSQLQDALSDLDLGP